MRWKLALPPRFGEQKRRAGNPSIEKVVQGQFGALTVIRNR
jgi:hypothetical protein